jgi:hypothetical protein
MKILIAAVVGFSVAACNQTSQTGGPGPVAMAPASAPLAEPTLAELPPSQALPPLYEPLIDLHRVKPERYQRDLAECRQQAAPQEAAARQAAKQQQIGTALQVAGAVASFIPVSTFRQAHVLATATDAAQSVGGATAQSAAMTAEQATQDYILVLNTCLTHRKYRILR